ncbi:AMP-binding protein [Henriciella litoralis]|uniref:AMP-binding protein n=1 Tax=Henriciella litoralis TaxID=568102 RepID=UPI0009FE86A7|nr:AMP-binding protein [Henriciella litoralis]
MLIQTVPEVLAKAVSADPEGIAIIDGDQSISYSALLATASKGAACLRSLNVSAGDRVALWAPNSSDWIIAALSIHLNGSILVPLNTRLKPAEAAEIVGRTSAQLVLTTERFLGRDNVAALRAEPSMQETQIISIDGNNEGSWPALLSSQKDTGPAASDPFIASPDDISDLIFTSGTTGLPKGVATTHAQTTQNSRAWAEAVGLTSDDTYLIVNPFFHTFGYKAGWLAALWFRTRIIPMSTFTPEDACRLIQEHRVTILPGPPTIFEDLLRFKDRDAYDISSLRAAVTGASVVPEELVRRMKDELGIEQVMTAYGLTECCGVATITGRADPIERISKTCGKAVNGVELMIADGRGIPVETGETGEILLRSEYNFKHYLDDPAATEASYHRNGWMKTGDLGRLDALGYLTITGRKKEMFICGGFNCYPAEIEHQIRQHPAVSEVAVIGMPDDRLGEVGAAFVTLEDGARLDEQALVDWSRDRIANYKVPRLVRILKVLPRNSLGKIEKVKLSQMLD